MSRFISLVAIYLVFLPSISAAQQIVSENEMFQTNANVARKVITLNEGWQFSYVNNVYRNQPGKMVSVPHTWNANEVSDTSFHYQRTSGVYLKKLFVPNEWKEKRLYLYFEGASTVADVFVNKKFAGNHKGGYTAFCIEITALITAGDSNAINVMVSNDYRLDVLPLHGDFNVYGGLHRPVSLIVTEQNCITPLDYASAGVYITTTNVSEKSAMVTVKTKFSLKQQDVDLKIRTTILDAANKTVYTQTDVVNTMESNQVFTMLLPHLWNGRADPYLYHAKVELLQSGNVIDDVTQSFGLRYYSVDPTKGFFLNGKYLDVHGVCFHEDSKGKGSAFNENDYETDLNLVKELGATGLRFTHYPHGKPMYHLCDENGLVVWTEIPFIGSGGYVGEGYVKSDELHAQLKQVLIEMIRQHYNHPAIMFWGLFNELTANFDNPVEILKSLNDLAHAEDATRLTTVADMLDNSPFEKVSDVMAWNKYYGWYQGNVQQIGKWADQRHEKMPGKAFGFSEYGAGASILHHADTLIQTVPNSKWHTEEWQTFLHESYWQQFSTRPFLWCKFIWVLADFGSTGRNEGDAIGINDKGLVTYDKLLKKDAFYFYKSNWNNEPMLHLTEKRNKQRVRNITSIKAYCNVGVVELMVNGKSIGKKKGNNYNIVVWENVLLKNGVNSIEVKAMNGKEVLQDKAEWTLQSNKL